MPISRTFVFLSIAAGILMALAGYLGVADSGTYAKETENWAGQAVGQDRVNLWVVFPVLLASSYLVLKRNSFRALLVWLGVLIYLIYSFVLYSFFVHFGPLFLCYVVVLGLSFYAFVGALAGLDWPGAGERCARVRVKPASVLLATVALLFGLLWLADILTALARGGLPADLEQVGLPVNPIHVLDLAILLPGAFIVAVLLWRRKTRGYVLAVPFLVFFVLMGLAIISMMTVTAQKGFAVPWPQLIVMGTVIAASTLISAQYLKRIQ